jgi:hypothetical protein
VHTLFDPRVGGAVPRGHDEGAFRLVDGGVHGDLPLSSRAQSSANGKSRVGLSL